MRNRLPISLLGFALLASVPAFAGLKGEPAAPWKKPAAFEEKNPENESPETRVPKYIRVNVAGYHVRSDTDFDVNKSSNVNHKTTHGALYAVTRVQKMQRGLAVGVYDGGEERWIYVPNWRKQDFQFCESEACFADLAAALKLLEKQNITQSQLASCGITLGENGEVVDASLPREVDVKALPKPRPRPEAARLDARVQATRAPSRVSVAAPEILSARAASVPYRESMARPARIAPAPRAPERARPAYGYSSAPRSEPARPLANFSLQRRPVWESTTGEIGRRWTAQLSESLDRYGQGLLNRRTLGDAAEFCPNYSRLSSAERKEFWMHLIPAMSRFESGYNPKATYDEATATNPRRGRVNPHKYSQGLMQLSYGSAAARVYRPFCNFDWSADKYKDVSDPTLSIYDTKKNLDCAVGILNKWVSQDGSVGGSSRSGGARFWSTLRYTNPKTKMVKALVRRYGPCSGR